MTHDEIIAVVQAHKDGDQIQWRHVKEKDMNNWHNVTVDVPKFFNFQQYRYRVKPEPREFNLPLDADGSIVIGAQHGAIGSSLHVVEVIKVREVLE